MSCRRRAWALDDVDAGLLVLVIGGEELEVVDQSGLVVGLDQFRVWVAAFKPSVWALSVLASFSTARRLSATCWKAVTMTCW